MHEDRPLSPPSPWVERFAGLVARGGAVLDLACGKGRHTRYFASRGHPVTAVDRNIGALGAIADLPGVEAIAADLEDGSPWPLDGRRFAGIVVTNYLYRPVLPRLIESLEPGGVLIYETFAAGNEKFVRPSNPAFLLRPGELLDAISGRLRVIAFEDGTIERPRHASIQRVCAVRLEDDAPPLPLFPEAEAAGGA